MKAPARHYWDAQAFLGWLGDDESGSEGCRHVLEAARDGEVLVATSSLTLVEIALHVRESGQDPQRLDQVQRFFLNSFILVRPLDRDTAHLAQLLLIQHPGLGQGQALHAATALNGRIRILETFDPALLEFHNRLGDPPLIIRRPHQARQIPLF